MPTGDALRPPLRVSVLGAGAMGTLHARVFAELKGLFTLVGIFDWKESIAGALAERWGVPIFFSEVEACDAADLVVIASPIEAHYTSGLRALIYDRHMLIEKPLAETFALAKDLVQLATRKSRIFVGHSERWNPVVRALRALVRPSEVRALRLVRAAPRTRCRRKHGALLSLGVHDLDLAAHLVAGPVAVRGVGHLDKHKAKLLLASAMGVLVDIEVDRRAPERARTLELTTKDAVYVGDLLHPSLRVHPRGGGEPASVPLTEEEPLVAQARAIHAVLSGGDEPVASGFDGARAIELVEQAGALAARHRTAALYAS